MHDVCYHRCTQTMARKQERKMCKKPFILLQHSQPQQAWETETTRSNPLNWNRNNILQVRENWEASLIFLGYTTEELLIQMFSQRLTQPILSSKWRQLPPPQTKMQTQSTALKCSSQQQRRYMNKWDSKTW